MSEFDQQYFENIVDLHVNNTYGYDTVHSKL